MTFQPGDIDVDLSRLRAFVSALHHDLDAVLVPGARRAHDELPLEVPFGTTAPGGQVVACREVVAAALQRARRNVAGKVLTARAVAEIIETMLASYTEADELAARRLAHAHHFPTLSDIRAHE